MLAWSLDAAKAIEASRVVTVLPKKSDSIVAWLDGQENCIQDSPKGTGHAVKAAKEQLADFHGVALIMFADTPLVTAKTLAALATAITDGSDIAVLGFEANDPVGYGRLVIGADQCLKKIVEHTDATKTEQEITLVNGGVMAVRCPLLFDLLEEVKPDNARASFTLPILLKLQPPKP